MTTLTIEQGNNIEVVPNAVIQKLYETALNSTNVTLSGNLQCEHCYEEAYNYLTGYITEGVKRFPDLAINVTGGTYIRFADPAVESVLIANNGYSPDGVGVTLNTARSIISMNKSLFNKNEEITSFDELEKFENLTSLGPDARTGYSEALFYNCINLQSIKLPSSIRVIGNQCFAGCSSLTAIQGDLSNVEVVGEGSFDKSGITNIDLSESKITSVDRSVFENCLNLTSVKLPPDEVSTIRKQAFYHCDNLESITGLSGTVTVYSGAFNRCSKLPQSFFQPLTFKLDSAGSDGTFYKCYLLTSINLSDDTYTIPSNCFDTCTGLTTIDTSHITQIGGSAFINCTNLQNVDLSNVTEIQPKAFWGCSSIDTVDLSSLTSAQHEIFKNCDIRNITLSKACQNISIINFSPLFVPDSTNNLQSFNIPDIKQWTTFNKYVLPYWKNSMPVDVLPFINAYQYLNAESFCAIGSSAPALKQLYVPKIQTCATQFNSMFNRLQPLFGSDVQGYLNSNETMYINLLYLKDVTTLDEHCFQGLKCSALVINNTTPPTCTTKYYATLSEYRATLHNINIDTWGNIEDATDPTASIQFDTNYYNLTYIDKKSIGLYEIDYIYVPDSAVNTYKAASGWGPVANKIKGLSELNGGVTYATEADWVAAGKPLALIEEYMDVTPNS